MAKRRKLDALVTREELLDAAAWCYHTYGVSGTTVAMIAAKAKHSRGALYWHFPEPSELLQIVLDRGRLPLMDRLAKLATEPAPILPVLRECVRQYLKEIQANERVRIALEILTCRCDFSGKSAVFRERQQRELNSMIELLGNILERASTSDELRSGACWRSSASLVGFALVGAIKLHVMQPITGDLEKEVMAALDIAFDSVSRPLIAV